MNPGWSVPEGLRRSPRWWAEGTAWLDGLPARVEQMCRHWGLVLDGPVAHGSNALVLPVRRGAEPWVLRLTPPDERMRAELAALRRWDGRGTVLVAAAEEEQGAMLLERLDAARSLAGLPLVQAAEVLATLARRLAVPLGPEEDVPGTRTVVLERTLELRGENQRCGQPVPEELLLAAEAHAEQLAAAPEPALAVDGDLHSEQVLAGVREPWLAVDPLLMRGDPGFDFARFLWMRIDEVGPGRERVVVQTVLQRLAAGARLDVGAVRRQALWRTVDYWLWALSAGLTEDPVRCARLAAALAGPR